jgi:hypothetical protein
MKTTKTLVTATLALLTLASAAHAQVAFRSSSSAVTTSGTPTNPATRIYGSSGSYKPGGPVRLYTSADVADVDPPTIRGSWPDGGTTTYKSLKLKTSKSGAYTFASVTRSGISTNPGSVLLQKIVTDPLPTAQTISGTLSWGFNTLESATTQNAYTKLHAYVLRGSDTVVGTLLTNYTESSGGGGTEWGGTLTCVGPAGGTAKAVTSVAAQAGDRIVIEAGFAGYSTRADTGSLYYGGSSQDVTSGCAAGGGWGTFLQFSQDLFSAPLTVQKPPSTVAADVMIATIAVAPNTATITTPAGWTLHRRIENTSATPSALAIYWRAVDASDASVSEYSWTTSGATTAVGGIRTVSGADTSNPIMVDAGQATASGTAHATPSVTTTAYAVLHATYLVAVGDSKFINYSSGGRYIEVATPTSTGLTISGTSETQTTAGATGAKTGNSAVAGAGIAHILAIRGSSGGSSTSLTINKPAGVVQNDVMIASITVGTSTATITPPSGWTPVRRTDNATGTSNSLAVYSKLATGSEAASYTWTLSSGNTGAAGSIQAFSGADPAIDVENGQTTLSGTLHTTPSVATAFSNTMLVTSHSVGATSAWTPPSGMTEAVDIQGGSQALETSYAPQAAPWSGAKTATSSGTGTGNAHILVLRRVFGAFNAFETTTGVGATGGVIKTKVAGTSISTDIVALNAPKNAVATYYVGTVKIEALDASNSSGVVDPSTGCNSTWTPITPTVVIPNLTFAAADNGRKITSFTVPNSYPNVRLRMSAPASAPDTIACSGDAFAIRPNQFNVTVTDADWQTADTTPGGTGRTLYTTTTTLGNVHKASQPFTVRATAVNGAGTPITTTNYAGTPTATVTQCGAGGACFATLGTLTLGGSSAAGVFSTTSATYSEAGSVALQLVDSTFASVDASDGSTATELNITSAPTNVGRFVPDRFEFVALNPPPQFRTFSAAACSPRSFTYIGQPFWYASGKLPTATLNAVNAAGAVTTNYAVTGSKPSLSESYADGSAPVALNSASKGTATLSSGAGTGTYSGASGGALSYTRGTSSSATVAPFSAAISLTVTASDATEAGVTGNGTITTPTALVFNGGGGGGIVFDGTDFNTLAGLTAGKTLVYGRLKLGSANGSQLVPLTVRAETQYWKSSAQGFVTNIADNCTTIANDNVQMSGFTGANFSWCKSKVTAPGVTLSSGRGSLLLTPPGNANSGTVLLTANLSAATSGQACTAVNNGTPLVPAAGADKTYLQGNWAGSTYTDNPSARASFGTFRGSDEVIFIRENF